MNPQRMSSATTPDAPEKSLLGWLSRVSCAAVLGLGYAWMPWPGSGWHVITGSHVVGFAAYSIKGHHADAIPVFLACVTIVISVLHTAATLVPSNAANHGWGFGLSTWLVALHALLGLGTHHDAISGATVSSGKPNTAA